MIKAIQYFNLLAILIVCTFSSLFSNQLFAQDLIDTKLKKIEILYDKFYGNDKFLFDRYNCVLHIGNQEINLENVKIEYEKFSKEDTIYPHDVIINCPEGVRCVSYESKSYHAHSFAFKNKTDAINFLNMLNEFYSIVKQSGFCNKK